MTIVRTPLFTLQEALDICDEAFALPYPPELEDRPGKIAWRRQVVKDIFCNRAVESKRAEA